MTRRRPGGFLTWAQRTAAGVGQVFGAFQRGMLPPAAMTEMWSDLDEREEGEELVAPTDAVSKIPTVYGCVDLLKINVAKYPLRFYIGEPDGDREELQSSTPGNIMALFRAPNPYDTGFTFMEKIAASLDLNGNAIVLLDQVGTRIRSMYVLPAHRVEVKSGPNFSAARYILHYGGRITNYDPDQIVHIRYWSPNPGPLGMAPMSPASLSYRTQRLAQRWSHAIYLRGGEASGVFTSEQQTIGSSARARLELQVKQRHRGPENAGRTLVLPRGVKRESTMLTPEQMKLIEFSKLTKTDIYEVFGIPPWMKGLKEGSSLGASGAEVDERLFTDNAVEPRCTRIADAFSYLLLRFIEPGLHCEFDLSSAFTRTQARVNTASSVREAVGASCVSVNEGRAWLGLAPLPGKQYDLPPETTVPSASAGPKPAATDPEPNPQDEAKARGRRTELQPITDQERARLDANLRRFERQVEQAWIRLVDAQERRTLSLLTDQSQASRDSLSEQHLSLIDALAVTPEERDYIESVFRFILETQGEAALIELGLKLDYSLARASAAEFIRRHVDRFITETTETTRIALREKLAEVTAAGGGLSESTAAVRAVFENRRDNALTIARTETAPAFNFATITAWQQAGIVRGKRWVTIHDGNAREAHEQADGQARALIEDFTVGGEALLYPGDPRGSASNVINCRCGMLALLEEVTTSAALRLWLSPAFRERNGHVPVGNRVRQFLTPAGNR